MENETSSPRWVAIIQYVVLAVVVLFIIGASLTSYTNLIAVFIGIMIAVLVSLFGGRMATFVKSSWDKIQKLGILKWWTCLLVILFLGCLAIAAYMFLFVASIGEVLPEPLMTPTSSVCNTDEPPIHKLSIENYEVFIEPATPDDFDNTFILNELFSYVISERAWDSQACRYKDSVDIEAGELPATRQVTSEKFNIFLEKVYVDTGEPVKVEMAGGKELSKRLCTGGPFCVEALITLKNMPKNSFYQFKYGEFIVEPTNEIDHQVVKWSVSDLSEGIQFTYLREPYNDFYPLVLPLLEIDSLPAAITSAVGFLGGIVVEPVVKNLAQKRYQKWVEKRKKPKA
jgi:hypothetical protein